MRSGGRATSCPNAALARPARVAARRARTVRRARDRGTEHRRRLVRARLRAAIARALDRLEHPKIVGTLAGDDTCLVITAGPADAKNVARELAAAIG
jgi:hypothetical protein